jgi:hypothetical protein
MIKIIKNTSLICSQTKNTEHPNFLATDNTYLALFMISSSVNLKIILLMIINYPGVT